MLIAVGFLLTGVTCVVLLKHHLNSICRSGEFMMMVHSPHIHDITQKNTDFLEFVIVIMVTVMFINCYNHHVHVHVSYDHDYIQIKTKLLVQVSIIHMYYI